MLQLLLMRHAKSDHGNPSLRDHNRPLNDRGRRDCPTMANWIAEQDLVPDRVLCSTSVRTRETADRMMQTWDQTPSIAFDDRLYLADPITIGEVIDSECDESQRLLVLAHNPGITSLAYRLNPAVSEMPNAAIAVFRLDAEEFHSSSGSPSIHGFAKQRAWQLTHCVSPKRL